MKILKLILFASLLTSCHLLSQQDDRIRFITEGGITLSHFQQQIKTEIGAERGERLTNEFQIGFYTSAAYYLNEYFAAGLYFRYDRGQRQLANFDGFDDSGRTLVKDGIGGTYTEFWTGPILHFFYKQLRASFGYGLYGIRDDTARDDIPSESGNIESAFRLDPSFAWLISLGGRFPVGESIDINISIEYRARYYNTRGGENLQNDINHGTQSISPLIGVNYYF